MKRVIKKEEYEVVKHNNLINIKSKFPYTLNQLKLICHLVSNIKPTDENLKPTKVNIIDLNFEMIEKGNNYSLLKDDLLNLLQNPFQIPNDGGYTNWFTYLRYEGGVIEYKFESLLKPYLLNLKDNFTSYQLKNILSLKSAYSIRMYELLNQYKVIGRRTIEIEELRNLLNIPQGYLNKDIVKLIKNTLKELTIKTDLTFDFEIIKDRRKFKSFEFTIQHNKKENLLSECNKQSIACKKSLSVKDKLK